VARQKILIHLSDRDKWRLVVKQAARLVEREGDAGLQITIIADIFAAGVCIACDRLLREEIQELSQKGFSILACEDSLRFLNLKPENLPEFIQCVPNGLRAILDLEDQGYHYIKA